MAFPDDDELETPKLEVGARGEVDVATGHRGHDLWAGVGECSHPGPCKIS
jgi:hypothetical protein